jgi:extracellular matrix regulatory protein A
MAKMTFIRIGYGNLVSASRIIAVVSPDSAPVKRLIQDSRDRGSLIDATTGKKTRSVLVMDSDHLVLSARNVEEIAAELDTVLADDDRKESRGDMA